MKRKHKEVCYYCGEKAGTDEHAPPKQMFKGFDSDSITVPSCDIHNSSKGGNDRAIVSAFIIPIFNSQDKDNLEEELQIAVQNNQSSFEKTKYKAIDSPLFKDSSGIYADIPNLAYLEPSVDIYSWIKQLTAAIVWDGIKSYDQTINWDDAGVWSPDWVVSKGPTTLEVEHAVGIMEDLKEAERKVVSLPWIMGWSAYPKSYPNIIYHFQILLRENFEIVIKHRFFSRYSWYAWFIASSETYNGLKDKIGS